MQQNQERIRPKRNHIADANLIDLGFAKDYSKVWNLQKLLVEQRIEEKIPDTLITVEHDHVLTMGRGSHLENVLVNDMPTFEIERGGDVTYHGPGQLVVYPILSLEQRGLSIREYVQKLENATVRTVQFLGVRDAEGRLGRETGVWTDRGRKKIASIGVAVSHWVTYHGLALNVSTDLSYFKKIKPCGFDSDIMTSISKELKIADIEVKLVKQKLVDSLSEEFCWDLTPTAPSSM